MLAPLAPYLGDALAAVRTMARTLRDPADRATILAALTGALVSAEPAQIHDHLREVLRLLAAGTRARFLELVPEVLAGISALAGPRGLLDLADAIGVTRRWWP